MQRDWSGILGIVMEIVHQTGLLPDVFPLHLLLELEHRASHMTVRAASSRRPTTISFETGSQQVVSDSLELTLRYFGRVAGSVVLSYEVQLPLWLLRDFPAAKGVLKHGGSCNRQDRHLTLQS